MGAYTAAIVTLLAGVLLAASLLLPAYWGAAAANGGNPQLEVVKTCLQVMGVVVVGAFVTLAGAAADSARRERAERESRERADQAAKDREARHEQAEKDRQAREDQAQKDRQARDDQAQKDRRAHEEALADAERRHRDLDIRSGLLDRAAECAQDMFIHYKHVKRKLQDAQSLGAAAKAQSAREALELLDAAYLRFATESRALETLINARFHAADLVLAEVPVGFPEVRIPSGAGQAAWRWHQVEDLLTVLYFAVTRNWRSRVLESNSLGNEDGKFHTGFDLVKKWAQWADPADPQDDERYRKIRRLVADEYLRALPEFVTAVLASKTRVDAPVSERRSTADPQA